MIKCIITSLLFSFILQQSFSQNLTGVWEGTMSGGEGIQVNIKRKKMELCGYTADYVINRPSSYCKANFRGWYDENEEVWVLVGTSFIENSGDHILMVLRLWHEDGDPENVLRGTEEAKYSSGSFFGMGGGDRGRVRLKKISSTLPGDMPDCFPAPKKPTAPSTNKEITIKPAPKKNAPVVATKPENKTAPVIKKTTPPKPVVTNKTLQKTKEPVKIVKAQPNKVDTVKKITNIKPVTIPLDIPDLTKKMNERKNTEFSRMVVHDKNIVMKVYDNGVVDNDTVSVFYNGKLIAGKKRLSEKAFEIRLELDENAPLHEIVLFAENLGSIPPNTALIVLTVDGKRYELHSSASLTENAVLTFEYKPK